MPGIFFANCFFKKGIYRDNPESTRWRLKMDNKPKYKDTRFFLIAIAFISAFNYYLTYPGIRLNGMLLITYMIDTIEGWLAWWIVRSLVLYLDQKMPFRGQAIKRIVVQLALTTLAGILVIILLTVFVSWMVKGRPPISGFFRFDIFIILIWFIVINAIYIGLHYYQEWQDSERLREEEKKLRAGGLTVKSGNQNLLIGFSDIMGFYSDSGYTYLQTWKEKKFLLDLSLENSLKLLPGESFFRLNRQYILQRNAISGYKKTGDGKLDILVNQTGAIPPVISVSRTRAVEFKRWWKSANLQTIA